MPEDIAGTSEEGTFAIVTVPSDQAQAVIDFVAGLRSKDADVSGHLLGGLLTPGYHLATNTNCSHVTTTLDGGATKTDITCSDPVTD